MLLQGLALLFLISASTFLHFTIISVVLGWGTAMVYPTFLATVAEYTHPHDRAKSLGTFRLWRDLGYALGAVLTGIIADAFNINASVIVIAMLTIGSACIIEYRMKCKPDALKLTGWFFNKIKRKKNGTKNIDQLCGLERPAC
jgi:MFS family permease